MENSISMDGWDTLLIGHQADPAGVTAGAELAGVPDPISAYLNLFDEFAPKSLHLEHLQQVAERLIELEPTQPEGYMWRANLRMALGCTFDEAVPDLEKAVSLDPEFARPLILLAIAYLENGKPTEALAFSDKVLAIAPDDDYAFELKAEANAALGNLAEAVYSYRKSIELGNSSPAVFEKLVDAYVKLGDMPSAQLTLATAIAAHPDNAELLKLRKIHG